MLFHEFIMSIEERPQMGMHYSPTSSFHQAGLGGSYGDSIARIVERDSENNVPSPSNVLWPTKLSRTISSLSVTGSSASTSISFTGSMAPSTLSGYLSSDADSISTAGCVCVSGRNVSGRNVSGRNVQALHSAGRVSPHGELVSTLARRTESATRVWLCA